MIRLPNKADPHDVAFAAKRFPLVKAGAAFLHHGQLHPNHTTFLDKDGVKFTIFHVKPVYYETVQGTWRPLSEVCAHHGNKNIVLIPNWYEYMSLRYFKWLMARQKLLGRELHIAGMTLQPKHLLFAATDDFFPQPHTETTTVDGYVRNFNASWTTCRTAATGSSADDSSAQNDCTQSGHVGGNYYIDRGFFLFDTSSIDDTDTIDAVTQSLIIQTKVDGDDDGVDYIQIYDSSPASNLAITTADFDAYGTTAFATQIDIGSISTSTTVYQDWTYTSTGRSNVSLTGITKTCFREGHDIENNTINSATQNSIADVFYADSADTTKDPKLSVTHSAAGGGGGGTGLFLTTLGVG